MPIESMVKFETIEELNAAIATLNAVGHPIPDWITEQIVLFMDDGREYGSVYKTLQKHSKFQYSDDLVKCITNTVNNLLVDTPNATAPGLLLGKIQCGKTNAFENIIGMAFDKGIDVCVDYGTACRSLHTQMEYGYNNSKFPNVTFVASKITSSRGFAHKSENRKSACPSGQYLLLLSSFSAWKPRRR